LLSLDLTVPNPFATLQAPVAATWQAPAQPAVNPFAQAQPSQPIMGSPMQHVQQVPSTAGQSSASSTSMPPALLGGGFGQPTANKPGFPLSAPITATGAAPSVLAAAPQPQPTITTFPAPVSLQQNSSAQQPAASALFQQAGSSQPSHSMQQPSVLSNAVTLKFNGFGSGAASTTLPQPPTTSLFQSIGAQPQASALQQPVLSGVPKSSLGASNLSFLQAHHAMMSQPPANSGQQSVLSGAPASTFAGFQTASQAPAPPALFHNPQPPTGPAQQVLSGSAPAPLLASGLGATQHVASGANSWTSGSTANLVQQPILSGATAPQVTGFHSNAAHAITPGASSQQALAAVQPTNGAAGQQPTLSIAQTTPFHQPSQLPGSISDLGHAVPQTTSNGVSNGAPVPTPAASSLPPQVSSTFGLPSAAQTTVGVNGTASKPFSSLFASANAPQRSVSPFGGPSTSINAEKAGTTSGASSGLSNGVAKPVMNPFATASIAPPAAQSSSQSQPAPGVIVTVESDTAAISKPQDEGKGKAAGPVNPFASTTPDHTAQPAVSALVPKKQAKNPFANEINVAAPQKQVSKLHQPTPPPVPSGPQDDFAKKVYDQLQKDGIKEPKRPADMDQPGAAEAYRDAYKKYRERARQSLIKADLIDPMDVQKNLDDALPFKGICEDMCPEFEKITRIVQNDVWMPEKVPGPDGTLHTSTQHMVKALARSAAGQEAPLPMDIRSVRALRKTLDYLIDEILVNDHKLPTVHNYLWDRTRAVRRDFVFHTQMSEQDLVDQVYCLETLARFHTISLHLLSQKGFAAATFVEQQEVEQLGKTLLSLMEAYKACRLRKIACKSEAEFRAYFIIHNAHAPDIESKLQEWEDQLWFNSDDVQTAISLASSLKGTSDRTGPLKPPTMIAAAAGSYTTFFRVVQSPKVSYTMACFAESHFKYIRRAHLRRLIKAYARTRDAPKDITVSVLNDMLRFDAEEDAVEFAESHGFEFSPSGGTAERYIILNNPSLSVGDPTIGQSYSFNLVERKRGGRPLPDVIRSTVFEQNASIPVVVSQDQQDDLFVGDDAAAPSSQATPASIINRNTWMASEAEQPTVARDPTILGNQGTAKAITSPASAAFQPQATSDTPLSAKAKTPGAGSGTSSILSKSPALQAANQAPAGLFSPSQTSPSPAAAATNRAAPNITLTPPTPQFAPATVATSSSHSENPGAHVGTGHQAMKQSASGVKSTASASTLFSRPSDTNDAQASSQKKTTSAQKAAKTAPPSSTRTPQSVDPSPGQTSSQKDLMGDFTEWFVLGDQGILEQFEEAYIEQLANAVFEQYIQGEQERERIEEERKRKEEDEESWAQARAFRKKSLMVTYFYRWRRIARGRSLNKRAQKAKADAAAWRAAEAKKKAEAKEKAAGESPSRKRKSADEGSFLEELRESKRQRASLRASRNSSAEAALLATGVFNGVRDEQETAARVVRDASADSGTDTPSVASAPAARVIRPPPRSLRDRLSSSVSKVKEIFKSSTSKTPNSKRDLFFPDSLPDKIYYARDQKGKLRRVPPTRPTSRLTNFDKSLSSSSVRTTPERKSSVRSAHWELRAMGFVHMPDNSYLHEDLAIPLLEGKRFPGMGTYGLPADPKDAETQAIKENSDRIRESPKYESPTRTLARARIAARQAQSTSASASPPSKRKRSSEDDEDDRVEISAEQQKSGSPSSAKKQKTTTATGDTVEKERIVTAKSAAARYSLDDTDKLIQEHRKVMAELDAGQQWFREQRELMERGNSPWDHVSVPR